MSYIISKSEDAWISKTFLNQALDFSASCSGFSLCLKKNQPTLPPKKKHKPITAKSKIQFKKTAKSPNRIMNKDDPDKKLICGFIAK